MTEKFQLAVRLAEKSQLTARLTEKSQLAGRLEDNPELTGRLAENPELAGRREKKQLLVRKSCQLVDNYQQEVNMKIYKSLQTLAVAILPLLFSTIEGRVCTKKVDVVFIVDSSGSIGFSNFNKVKEFVREITEAFKIGNEAAHVGAMQFSVKAEKVFFLNGNRKKVLKGIDDMAYQRGSATNTAGALQFAREVMFLRKNGARQDVPRVAIFVSDGKSTKPADTKVEAKKNHAFAIATFAVGIGNARVSELEYIGSKPSSTFVHHVDNFNDLKKLAKQLTTKTCVTEKKPCSCWVSGDPHYHTCDGLKFDYMGRCTYVLTKTCSKNVPVDFEIQVSNEMCNGGTVKRPITCTKSAEINVYGIEIRVLKTGKVMVDGHKVTPPYTAEFDKGRFVKVDLTSCRTVVVETDFGLKVRNKGRRLDVTIPADYRNKLCGLCGNFNGNKFDDAVLKNGKDVGKDFNLRNKRERNKAYALVGNSWLVTSSTKHRDPACTPAKPPTDCAAKHFKKAQKLCWVLQDNTRKGVFVKCLKRYYGDAAYDDCVFDVCRGRDHCESIASFAEECRLIGALRRHWRRLTKCPLNCGKNAVYRTRMTACPATCADPHAPKHCGKPKGEGCACKRGYILEAGNCVKRKKCGCASSDGSYHKHGERWLTADCKFRKFCRRGKICEKPFWCKKTCGLHGGTVVCK